MMLQSPCTGPLPIRELLRKHAPTAPRRDAPDPVEDDDPSAAQRRALRCRACDQDVADVADRFALPGHAAVQVHANPAGHIFEILTVRDARHLTAVGPPSDQFTWFPGYAWTIVVCGRCARHLGWHFAGDGAPTQFYGLLVDRVVES